jgi:SAM-dependent methyltransferase
MFFNYRADIKMDYETYIRVLEYMTVKSKTTKLENLTTLDISYNEPGANHTYRITINGLDTINKYMEMLHLRNNHVIFSVLVEQMKKDKAIYLVKKIKNIEDRIDLDQFGIRVRSAPESPVTKEELDILKSLDETKRDFIRFRFKQRASLILKDTKEEITRIDLTNVKMANSINRLEKTPPTYELELDNTGTPTSSSLKEIFAEATRLLKIIQQSNYLITKDKEEEILNIYSNLIGVKRDTITSLVVRKPQSLEIQHVVDKLPNKYAVTDKADGERFCLIIADNTTYLISDNLSVRNTGITVDNKQYNNTILDGEYVFIPQHNRYVYLGFDCLFKGGEDIRKVPTFLDRLKHLDDVIRHCFTFKGQKGFNFPEYNGKYESNKLLSFYNKLIDDYMDSLNHDLANDKKYSLIRRKIFLSATGVQSNEIFKYTELMWQKYVYDKRTNCPYTLDGTMTHPLDQKYVTSVKESKLAEYKWKPPEKNSIDFYILFEKSAETGKVMILYDNSRDDFVKGKPYKIAHLHVGRKTKTGEQPVLFQEGTDKYIAYLFLRDGEVRDIEGKILQDATVVEFYYNNNTEIPEKHRWTPMRTRHDKTQLVRKFGIKYGNYIEVANKVWRSIQNPVLIKDFTILSKDDMYDKHIIAMRGRIAHSVIMSEQQENEYYQKTTNLALPMRNFHNWIKSILIYTHCNPTYEQDKSLSVLDIGCGRGGDIMKFYYAKVSFYVGIDLNNPNLISPVNGAISRYNQLRRTHANFPRMYFIHADAGTLLDYDEQVKTLGPMSRQNKEMITKFFSLNKDSRTQFDRINCQFALHYMMPDMTVWNNFVENINMYLKPGGYFLVTTFDAEEVLKALGTNEKFTAYYTNSDGEQEILFEIIKKFTTIDDPTNIGPGYAIDVYNALILQEENYITEYLVHKKFLEDQLRDRCGLTLVETDLFGNQFKIHEEYFKKVATYEENSKTRKFLMNAAEYYNQKEDVNKTSYQMTKLNRYYIFRRDEAPIKKPESKPKKQQKGGATIIPTFTDIPLTINNTPLLMRELPTVKDYSFFTSIHDVLQTTAIIPKTLPMFDFFKDLKYDVVIDADINNDQICSLCTKLSVGHDFSEASTNVAIDGVNIIVFEKEDSCDNESSYIHTFYPQTMIQTQPVILLYRDENNTYYPIYKKNKTKYTGLFNPKVKFLKDLRK